MPASHDWLKAEFVQGEEQQDLATHLLDAAPAVVFESPGLRLWHRALAVNRLPKVGAAFVRHSMTLGSPMFRIAALELRDGKICAVHRRI